METNQIGLPVTVTTQIELPTNTTVKVLAIILGLTILVSLTAKIVFKK